MREITLTFEEFSAQLSNAAPAPDWPPLGQALWHAANDNWVRAHELTQRDDSPNGAWLHAYLHRVEGDLANAGYWYRKAEREPATGPLQEEWEQIARALLIEPGLTPNKTDETSTRRKVGE